MPAVRAALAAAITLAIILLILRAPELPVVTPGAGRSYSVGGRGEAGCIRILTLLHRLVVKGRVR